MFQLSESHASGRSHPGGRRYCHFHRVPLVHRLYAQQPQGPLPHQLVLLVLPRLLQSLLHGLCGRSSIQRESFGNKNITLFYDCYDLKVKSYFNCYFFINIGSCRIRRKKVVRRRCEIWVLGHGHVLLLLLLLLLHHRGSSQAIQVFNYYIKKPSNVCLTSASIWRETQN